MKSPITSQNAPAAIGPYSHGCRVGGLVFSSGQLGIDPKSNEMLRTVGEQTHQCFKNLSAVLEDGGSALANCVKVTVYLSDMNNFAEVNDIYRRYFTSDFPARTCVEVSRLPKDALVEVEAVAFCK